MAQFARALGGERGAMPAGAFGAVLDAYLRASSPDRYGRLASAMRSALLRDAEYRRIRLTRSLTYAQYAPLYRDAGLTGDRKRDEGLEKAAFRRLQDARRDLESLERGGGEAGEDPRAGFVREVAAVGRRMGFGIDMERTKIGTYIGYLELINEENKALEAAKAKKNRL